MLHIQTIRCRNTNELNFKSLIKMARRFNVDTMFFFNDTKKNKYSNLEKKDMPQLNIKNNI